MYLHVCVCVCVLNVLCAQGPDDLEERPLRSRGEQLPILRISGAVKGPRSGGALKNTINPNESAAQ